VSYGDGQPFREDEPMVAPPDNDAQESDTE
jgi:hypothetical protein